MLHSSSLHYYAYCCALICLLCQQHQRALAVTIIIDGASSNEWATRDEYQRLADGGGAAAALAAGAPLPSPEANGGLADGGPLAQTTGGAALLRGQQGGDAAADLADLADLLASSGGVEGRRLGDEEPQALNQANSFRGQQQQPLAKPVDELDRALDRLDLIERERQAEAARLRDLETVEREAESGVAHALGHQARASGHTLDLSGVPPEAYVALASANRRRKTRDLPKRHCGEDLVKMLEFVCKQRFYDGESQAPEVAAPKIKEKRSVSLTALEEFEAAAAASNPTLAGDDEPQQVARRRKLRTHVQRLPQSDDNRELDGDGGPAATSALTSSQRASSSSSSIASSSAPTLSASSPSSSASSSVNDGSNTQHNQPHQQQRQQQLEYLSNINEHQQHEQGQEQRSQQQQANGLRGSKMKSKRALLRRIRGVSEECCARPCSPADMEAYCAKVEPRTL